MDHFGRPHISLYRASQFQEDKRLYAETYTPNETNWKEDRENFLVELASDHFFMCDFSVRLERRQR